MISKDTACAGQHCIFNSKLIAEPHVTATFDQYALGGA